MFTAIESPHRLPLPKAGVGSPVLLTVLDQLDQEGVAYTLRVVVQTGSGSEVVEGARVAHPHFLVLVNDDGRKMWVVTPTTVEHVELLNVDVQ